MSAMTKSVGGGGQQRAWDSQRVRNFTLNLFRKMKKTIVLHNNGICIFFFKRHIDFKHIYLCKRCTVLCGLDHGGRETVEQIVRDKHEG